MKLRVFFKNRFGHKLRIPRSCCPVCHIQSHTSLLQESKIVLHSWKREEDIINYIRHFKKLDNLLVEASCDGE
jgi:hypothetical protein